MSHTVPISECPDPSVHGRPFRYCPYCEWREQPAPKTSITIPWPPSDELVERVAHRMADKWGNGPDGWREWIDDARDVLDAIGGAR